MSQQLTKSQIKFLRGIGHNINPMLMVGQNGITESVMEELEKTLEHHEILKIKLSVGDRTVRQEIIQHILQKTGAALVQSIGKTCLIYRKSEESDFELPK